MTGSERVITEPLITASVLNMAPGRAVSLIFEYFRHRNGCESSGHFRMVSGTRGDFCGKLQCKLAAGPHFVVPDFRAWGKVPVFFPDRQQ